MAKAKYSEIPAAAYLRKSTDGEGKDGKKRQENSIPQQLRGVSDLRPAVEGAKYKVIRQYADPGVSGWKRNAARPDFARMLADCTKNKDIKAILVDDLDRFSRATNDEFWTDINELRRAGVRWIHAANQGLFDISDPNDIGTIIKLTVGAWSANDFSRKLGRRIAELRYATAEKGKRTGGPPPYGLANDGDGGLKPGDPARVKIVRRIFDEFVNQLSSINGIASRLNRDGIKAPRGGKWSVECVKQLLRQAAYRGTFEYNRRKSGHFFIIDADGKAVDAATRPTPTWQSSDVGVFKKEGAYEPLVDPKQWGAAQVRLAGFKCGRRPREGGFALTGGILVCDHCGRSMTGAQPTGRNYLVYRCSANGKRGMGACGCYEIREELILPYLLKMLGEEIEDLSRLQTACPQELMAPHAARDERRDELEQQAAALRAKIDKAVEAVMFADDARSRQIMDAKLKEMWAEHDRIRLEIETAAAAPSGPTADDLAALADWWEEFNRRAIYLPLDPAKYPSAAAYAAAGMPVPEFLRDAADAGQEFVMQCDRRAVNEALHGLGCEVRLRWERVEETLADGRTRPRNRLVRGRFRLGQKSGVLPGKFYQAGSAEPGQQRLPQPRADSRDERKPDRGG